MKEQISNISVRATGTLREVVQVIDKGNLGTALLIDPETETFVGVVTDGDVRRAFLGEYDLETPVSMISRPESVRASVGTPISEISSLFSDAVRVIPLLDASNKVVDLAVFDKRIHLPVAEPSLSEKELRYVNECVLTGWVSSGGKFVRRFEETFANFCGVKHGIATSNGTSALHLALLACNIGPEDEVIVPSLTFIATANAVSYTGATPVFVDSECETWNIDPSCIEQAITSKTRAVIPVHIYGHSAHMGPILEIAGRYGLSVIEDAAEAHGALYKDSKVGSLGDLGIFSFFGNKIITTGEGGMVVTNSDGLAEKIRILRDHGMDQSRRYCHPVLGYNYRLTNMQAALGVAQMEKIELILSKKRFIAQIYKEALENIPGLTLPNEAQWARSVFWLYSILVDEKVFGMTRDELREKLKEQGIETRPLFPPVHLQPIYANGQKLPVAERLSSQGLSLPSSARLSTDDVKRVSKVIRDAANEMHDKLIATTTLYEFCENVARCSNY